MGQTVESFVDYWCNEKKKYILPQYCGGFLNLLDQIKKIPNFEINDLVSTPNEIVQLLKIAIKHNTDFRRFTEYNAEFVPISIRSRDDCTSDLKAISREVDSLYLSDDLDYILVKKTIEMYNPFTDNKFNFGQFKIKMYSTEVTLEAIGKNTKRDGHFHPYVKNNRLCLGEYKDSYKLFYQNMMFYDAWLTVYKCLTSYGGDQLNGSKAGPEHAMNAWIGFQCEVCKGSMQPEDTVSCVKTKSLICKDCVNTGTCTDEVTGEYYLQHFIKKCNSCGKNASTVINNRCLSCRMN